MQLFKQKCASVKLPETATTGHSQGTVEASVRGHVDCQTAHFVTEIGNMGSKQPADLISGMVMRLRGSTSSILGMRSLAPGDRWLGRL